MFIDCNEWKGNVKSAKSQKCRKFQREEKWNDEFTKASSVETIRNEKNQIEFRQKTQATAGNTEHSAIPGTQKPFEIEPSKNCKKILNGTQK